MEHLIFFFVICNYSQVCNYTAPHFDLFVAVILQIIKGIFSAGEFNLEFQLF